MAEYEKKVRQILRENGCSLIRRGKGDHDIWFSPITRLPIICIGDNLICYPKRVYIFPSIFLIVNKKTVVYRWNIRFN